MSGDFTLEQLKTVLDNMVDSLDQTKGDEGTHAELEQIKQLIKDIQKDIETQAKNTDKENRALVKDFFEQWDRHNPLRDLRKAVDDLGKKSDNPLRQGGNGGGGNKDGGGSENKGDDENPLKALNGKDVAKNAGKFGKAFGAATAVLGALAQAGGMGLDFIKNNANAYRQVLNSAEGSINNIMDMRNTAARNQMSVEQLIDATKSEGVRTAGLKQFAGLQLAVRNFGLHVGSFGLTAQQMMDYTGDFMDAAKQYGALNTLKNDDSAKMMTKLLVVNQEMAGYMGKTAEQSKQDMIKAQTDPNFNASLRGSGMSDQNAMMLNNLIGQMPEAVQRAAKEAYSNFGAIQSDDLKVAVAADPELRQFVSEMGALRQQGAGADPMAAKRAYEKMSRDMQANKGRNKGIDTVAGVNHYGTGSMDFLNQIKFQEYQLNTNKHNQLNDDGSTGDKDPFTQGALKMDEAGTRFAAAMDDVFNSTIEPWTKQFGQTFSDLVDKMISATDKIHGGADWLRDHPKTAMTGGGLAALGWVAGSAGLSYLGGKGLKGLWNGAKNMTGRGGTGAAAGAAEGAAGGLGRWGSMLKGGGMALKGNALIGGLLESTNYIWGDKAITLKNLAKSGLAVGGGALGGMFGGALGSLAGPVGTLAGGAAGGMGGYKGGQMLGDWLFGADDSKAAMAAQDAIKNPSGVTAPNKPVANASPSQPGGSLNDLIHLDKAMLDMQHKIHFTLLDLKKASYDQLDLMRAEIAQQKAQTDRLARLLEDGNRLTKQIAGNS